MNKEKIKNLNEVIKEIENCNYIDCHEDETFDDYQYENILYYLKQLKKQQEINKKAIDKLNSFISCCRAEKLESGSDYLHHQYWNMFENFNKQIKDILNEVSE